MDQRYLHLPHGQEKRPRTSMVKQGSYVEDWIMFNSILKKIAFKDIPMGLLMGVIATLMTISTQSGEIILGMLVITTI